MSLVSPYPSAMAEGPPIVLLRRQTLPNPAASFVENKLQLQGDNGGIEFSAQVNAFVGPAKRRDVEKGNSEIWQDAHDECERLFEALEALKKKLSPHLQQQERKIDIRKSSWDQVVDEVRTISDHYKNLDGLPPAQQKIKRCLRTLGQKGSIFEHWLEILPDGDYGSSISGAFRLILTASASMHGVRETIYEALNDIPKFMDQAEFYVEIYDSPKLNTRLLQITATLYTTIIIALRKIIEFFMKGSMKRFGKALILGNSYESSIKSSIANVKTSVQDLNGEANRCVQARIRDMERTQNNAQKAIVDEVIKVKEHFYRSLASMPNYGRRTKKNTERPAGQILEPGNCVSRIPTVGSQPVGGLPSTSSPRPSVSPSEPPTRLRKGFSSRKLLEILDFDSKTPAEDIGQCLNSMYSMSPRAIDDAHSIITSPELRAWLAEPVQSRVLLIQGGRDGFEPESPSSFLCAHLSRLLSPEGPAIVISHMCSMHKDFDDDRDNAKGMLVSLMGQLLSQAKDKGLKFNLAGIKKNDRRLLLEDDLGTLGRILRKLVKQIPKGRVLFCLIDAIPWYESQKRKDDTLKVFRMLQRLIREKKDVLFKLLLTCSDQTLYIHELMDNKDVLWVPDDVDGDGQGAWDPSAGRGDVGDLFE